MRTEQGLRRLIHFTDAVVAIALTLLILPLTEIPRELDGSDSFTEVFTGHAGELTSFAVSFLVLWVLWAARHRTMEYFRTYDDVLLWLTMAWLGTIVVLPFTTQLLVSDFYDQGAATLYVGVLLLASLCQLATFRHGRQHRELLVTGPPEIEDWLENPPGRTTAGILVLSLVLSVVAPQVGTFPLLLLFVVDPINALVRRFGGTREQRSVTRR